jgi:tetratricopeptide (TPR) repeat protein
MERIASWIFLICLAGAAPAAATPDVPLWWPLEDIDNDYQLLCERRLQKMLGRGWLEPDPARASDDPMSVDLLYRSQVLFAAANDDFDQGEAAAAYAALDEALDLLQDRGDWFAIDLIPVLTAQSRVDMDNGAYGRAVEKLRRARAIFRRASGLNAACQGIWLEAEANAHAAVGDLMAADSARLLSYRLRRNPRYDQHQLQVDALVDLATWQRDLHASLPPEQRAGLSCLIASAFSPGIGEPRRCHQPGMRELYKRAVRLLEKNEGDDSPSLVEPLRGLALSYLYGTVHWKKYGDRVGFHGPYHRGRKMLRRALDIAEQTEFGADDATLATLLIDLGDWHSIYDHKPREAQEYYARAWSLMTGNSDQNEVPKAFERPVRLIYLPAGFQKPQARGQMSDTGPMLPGWARVEFTVTPEGRAEEITVVENNPPHWTRHNRDIKRSMATSRFRPAWRDGRPVPVRAEILYRFRYPAPTEMSAAESDIRRQRK